MRLLNVIRSVDPASGGMAEGLRQSVLATRAMGHVEEVLTLDAPHEAWVRSFPATTHAIGPAAGLYGHSQQLVPWLRDNAQRYDAVVVHGLWQFHSLAVHRALRAGPVPYFIYPHGMLDPWFKRRYPLKHLKKWLYWPWADYRVLRDAAAVLFTAAEEARLAAQSFWLYRAKPAVVGYGVALGDPALLGSAEEFAAAWPQTRGKRIALFMSRLHPKKGGDLLIEAFAQIADSAPELHLVMAGPDGSGVRAELEALAERLGVAHRITWTGMLSGSAKWSALKAAEVFVLPSHQENFGIVVVEALAMGVPVLISDKVNIWREIVDGGAGFAASDTAAGTVECLQGWLKLTEAQRSAMKLRAAACYQQHFHMAAAARRLIDTITPHAGGAPLEPALIASAVNSRP
ncbi:MAG: glycosyltransferase [Cytophagales bacterium]|nr:glycosyltransferase [Rhizobacter sp.]